MICFAAKPSRATDGTATVDHLQISPASIPQVVMVANASCQSLSSLPPHPCPCQSLGTATSSGFCSCESTGCQARPLQLTLFVTCMLRASSSAVHRHSTGLSCSAHARGELCSHGRTYQQPELLQLLVGLDQTLSSVTGLHHCVHLQLVSLAALEHTTSLTLIADLLCSAYAQEEIVLLHSMPTVRNPKLPVNP